MKRAPKVDWKDTPSGREAYRVARAGAQALANELGFDVGLEANDVLKDYRTFLLPERRNRQGYELRCEVVMCEILERCQKGHGPCAK